jgi:hypothetical protein
MGSELNNNVISAFSIPCFRDFGFYYYRFWRLWLLVFCVLEISAFSIPGISISRSPHGVPQIPCLGKIESGTCRRVLIVGKDLLLLKDHFNS